MQNRSNVRAGYQPWHSSQWFNRWIALARHAALLLACVWSVSASSYYVSTSGSATNAGTINAPLSLDKALGNTSPATAGDTIYLRGGTYTAIRSFVSGASGNPVTIQSYGSEWAKLTATVTNERALWIEGHHAVYKNFECLNSSTNRVDDRTATVDVFGHNNKLINLVIHDGGIGIGHWRSGAVETETEVYGCLIYNNGWESSGNWHGHGIYAQNDIGVKLFRDNIVFNNMDFGFHCYAESTPQLGFTLDGNVSFSNGAINSAHEASGNYLIGGTTQPASDIVFGNNLSYHAAGSVNASSLRMGYSLSLTNANCSVFSNYLAGGTFQIRRWTNATVTANTVILRDQAVYYWSPSVAHIWNTNSYNGTSVTPFVTDGTNSFSFTNWKAATGHDANSTLSASTPFDTVFVRPNAYESGRANVIVYNWSNADNVSVDLSSVCQNGRAYTVRNAADYYGAVVKTFTYAGSAISLPMTNLTVAVPVGASAAAATGPTFNAFVVQPVQGTTVMQAPTVRAGKVRKKL
jgi:hypothetical protein